MDRQTWGICAWKSLYLLDTERQFSFTSTFVIQIEMAAVGSVRHVFNNISTYCDHGWSQEQLLLKTRLTRPSSPGNPGCSEGGSKYRISGQRQDFHPLERNWQGNLRSSVSTFSPWEQVSRYKIWIIIGTINNTRLGNKVAAKSGSGLWIANNVAN